MWNLIIFQSLETGKSCENQESKKMCLQVNEQTPNTTIQSPFRKIIQQYLKRFFYPNPDAFLLLLVFCLFYLFVCLLICFIKAAMSLTSLTFWMVIRWPPCCWHMLWERKSRKFNPDFLYYCSHYAEIKEYNAISILYYFM